MRQVFIGAGKKMFDRLDMGSAQTYYWLLESLVGLREINTGEWQDCCLFI